MTATAVSPREYVVITFNLDNGRPAFIRRSGWSNGWEIHFNPLLAAASRSTAYRWLNQSVLEEFSPEWGNRRVVLYEEGLKLATAHRVALEYMR